jgi:RNA polymerase sigma-70 factor (ECF subfamily)
MSESRENKKMQTIEFKNDVLIYKDQMFRLALRILKNEEDANDIVQDSLLKLWDKRKVLADIKNIKSFSMTMVRNACIDLIRKHKPLTDKEQLILQKTDELNPELEMVVSDQLKMVRKIIDRMNEQQREVIQLREIEGLDYEEISEITGLTINNLRVIISRARKEIREKIMTQMNFHNNQ